MLPTDDLSTKTLVDSRATRTDEIDKTYLESLDGHGKLLVFSVTHLWEPTAISKDPDIRGFRSKNIGIWYDPLSFSELGQEA